VEEGDGAGAGAVGEVGGAEEEVPRRFKMGPMAVVDHGGGREVAEGEGEEYGEEGGDPDPTPNPNPTPINSIPNPHLNSNPERCLLLTYTVGDGPWVFYSPAPSNATLTLTLASDLNPSNSYDVKVYLSASCESGGSRWHRKSSLWAGIRFFS